MSLYPIVPEFESSGCLLSPSSVEGLVNSLMEVLLEQQLTTTVWVKPATTWMEEIDRYLNEGKVVQTYWCQTFAGKDLNKTKRGKLLPIKLQTTADLEREFFVLVISTDFSVLILAQQQPISTMPTKLTGRPSVLQFKVFCSVDAQVIKGFLQQLKDNLDLDDSDSKNFPTDLSLPTGNTLSANLLLKLLFKELEHTDNLNLSSTSSDYTKSHGNITNQSLLLQEQFIDQLSRELRPPLTNMKTAICLLESKYLKISQRERYLELLHKEWSRQNDLLTGLLDLVHLDHLSSLEQSQTADIKEILPGIISTYQPIAKEKNIELISKIYPEIPLVACSQLWVRQIILNLLNNSLKFTDEGGRVAVEAILTSRGVELSFSDTGVGINGNELNKIFESFYRGKNYLGEENKGAGLGLSIVKQLLDRCQGSITVNSQVNKGSVFRVLFKTAGKRE
ncbi:MAG: hypothetical protein EA365_02390 [Gloeocapsa sp. DLM2.Bin57]|nr:MAG: hypothetical protein EA365_02390 [Gloeocapsa sp. DLM2.Bin57]